MAAAQTEKKASAILIKSHYEQAARFIDKGITFDEKGDKEQANTLYNKALKSIDVGLAIKCHGSGHDGQKSRETHEKLKKLKSQVEERLKVLSSNVARGNKAPPRPPPPLSLDSQKKIPHSYIPVALNDDRTSVQSWEDAKELLSIKNGVTMFFVSEQGHVTTLYEPQTLRAMQLLNQASDSGNPKVFLQCGSWLFPLIPGRSPVLKTEQKTFMIPDINLDSEEHHTTQQQLVQGRFPTVGLVFSPEVDDDHINRFERILKCYADYRHYTSPSYAPTNDQATAEPSEPADAEPEVASEGSLVPAGDGNISVKNEDSTTWGAKVSKGIEVGAVLISWGLSRGAQLGGSLINQGSEKLRGKIKPNEESAKIDPKLENNMRQIKTATGVACQVSVAVVSAVSALTYELGKQLAPIIVDQGAKLLPQSAKRDNGKGQAHIQEVMKVAVGGVQGIAVVHEGLSNAWKILYSSLSQATVTTVDHKYGEQAGRVTGDALGAVGNAVEVYHNVNHLGYKALAKKAVKQTGKECIYDANKKYSNNKN